MSSLPARRGQRRREGAAGARRPGLGRTAPGMVAGRGGYGAGWIPSWREGERKMRGECPGSGRPFFSWSPRAGMR